MLLPFRKSALFEDRQDESNTELTWWRTAAPPDYHVCMSEVTRLLVAIGDGDRQATAELRRLARSKMAQERGEHTLQATALVHEAYLRLVGDGKWEGRGHFFAAAAEAMRRILIEHARNKNALKRGGEFQRVALEDALPEIVCPGGNLDDLLELNDALDRLAGSVGFNCYQREIPATSFRQRPNPGGRSQRQDERHTEAASQTVLCNKVSDDDRRQELHTASTVVGDAHCGVADLRGKELGQ
jgi:hypothetical protein